MYRRNIFNSAAKAFRSASVRIIPCLPLPYFPSPLLLHSFCPSFLSLRRSRPLKSTYVVWGSAVNSVSGVWCKAPAETILVHFSLKI